MGPPTPLHYERSYILNEKGKIHKGEAIFSPAFMVALFESNAGWPKYRQKTKLTPLARLW